MMSNQLVTVALLVTLAAVAVNASSMTAGSRESGDFKALPVTVIRVKAVPGKPGVSDQTVDMGRNVITKVVAVDQDNKGASTRITSGGPGSTSVSVHFQSPNGVGLDYVLHIFIKRA